MKSVLFTLILCTSCFSERKPTKTSHFNEHVGHGYPVSGSASQAIQPKQMDKVDPAIWTLQKCLRARGEVTRSTSQHTHLHHGQTTFFSRLIYQTRTKRSMQKLKLSLSHNLWSAEMLSMNALCSTNARKRKVRRWIHLLPHFTCCLNTVIMASSEKRWSDRIVVGIRDATPSLKLQLMETLTLDKALTKVREAKAIKCQQPLLRSD